MYLKILFLLRFFIYPRSMNTPSQRRKLQYNDKEFVKNYITGANLIVMGYFKRRQAINGQI